MKIRSTERVHSFAKELFQAIPLYEIQGLTLNAKNEFTAGIEAVEVDALEDIDLKGIFTRNEWKAKCLLCSKLKIPFYLLKYKDGEKDIIIYDITFVDTMRDIKITINARVDKTEFPGWWLKIKGTIQSKQVYEARERIDKSTFDNLIESKGLSWGGNIDGYFIDDSDNIRAIVEKRTTNMSFTEYDPAHYFRGTQRKSGDYKTWEPLIILALKLNTPLFLMTFDGKSEDKVVGFSVVKSISNKELIYQTGPPYRNILHSVEEVKDTIIKNLTREPPEII